MLVYLSIFLFSCLYLYYAEKYGRTKSTRWLGFFLFFISLLIGLGDMIGGYDRYIYAELFDDTYDNRLLGWSLKEIINSQGSFDEKGYMVFNYLISFLTANRYIFILLSTMLMYVMYFFAIKKYTIHYPMACVVFLGFFYYFTMTYLRQTLAVGLVWLSVEYIIKRDIFKFVGLVVLATTFHTSALIFLPMYFIGSNYYSLKKVYIFLFICLLLGFSPLPNMLVFYSGEVSDMQERYGHSAASWGGARMDYIIEVLFFLWVLFKNRHVLPTDKKSLVFINTLYVFCAILLFFMRMGQGGRFGWYYMIGIIYVLSYLSVNRMIIKDMKQFVVLVCFVLFYRITSGWNSLIVPYKTFLTNGYPGGDRHMYEKFEYDHNYTKDKFYRDPWVLW